MSALDDYPAGHPIVSAWDAWLAADTKGVDRSDAIMFHVFEAGWNALRDMMQAAPVFFAENEGEVAQMLGNTLAEASAKLRGKPS